MAVDIVVPEVGESIVDARVAKWLKKEGDAVAAGDPLVELETDKIDLEVAATASGVLGSITHKDGADVKVGDVLGTIEEGGRDEGAAANAQGAGAARADAQGAAPDAEGAGGTRGEGAGKTRATPAARKAAQQNDVDLKSVKGSGDAGRVMRRDVEAASAPDESRGASAAPAPSQAQAPVAAKPAPQPAARRVAGERTEERVRMSKRRATIAKRLIEAQSTAAMLTTFNEVDMSAVQAMRARHKETFKERFGVNLGMTAFFVKAVIGALRAFPRINAEIQGDEMVMKGYYDIGIAVGASEGLVVPVLRDADLMTFSEIEAQTRALAKKAEDGTLSLADLKGGTFTITNGGVFGSLQSTPILNPPQVGILGLHAIKDRPVAVGGQVVIRPMMYTALTYDHRIVDGSEAVRFLVRIRDLVEDPGSLLLD
ncbi:MAG: 2-oxoglutarate dehydrogenase complex dihydrolipoyllysine-residue succinyltransferase [Acidobacteria bacterium]|nr:2-oxoglutarate dehydrogenase complex dihydrolipoyllysine-residue succinyltransferase [Acidobacteriota bacterium]